MLRHCILQAIKPTRPAPAAATTATALTQPEMALLREWMNQQNEWIPLWVHSSMKTWKAVRIARRGGGTITITVISPSVRGADPEDTVAVRYVRAHMYPVVSKAYGAVASYMALHNRAHNRAPGHNVVDMHAVYIAHPRKRVLPDSDKVILPVHINGGFSVFGQRSPANQPWRVVVYRTEDATKVMLHEMMHLLHLDGDQVSESVETAWARRHFVFLAPPTRRLSIREAVAETLACFVYAVAASSSAAAARGACARMGHRIDAIAADLLARAPPFADGTHAFAYAIARAALWDGENGACDELLRIVESGSTDDVLALLDVRIPALAQRLKILGSSRPPKRRVGLGLVEF
jgi:hypothetical protein